MGQEQETAIEILRLFRGDGSEAWDLHAFFELVAGDDQDRRASVLDVVDRLVTEGCLESRGSDFFTITRKGEEAVRRGEVHGW